MNCPRHVADGDEARRRPPYRDAAAADLQIVAPHFEHPRSDTTHLLAEFGGRDLRSRAAEDDASRARVSESPGADVRVALYDLDVLERYSEFVGDYLRDAGFVA